MSTRNKKQLRRKAPERRRIDSGIPEKSKLRKEGGHDGDKGKVKKNKKHKASQD